MVDFNDRRPHIPKAKDYETPLTRWNLVDANKRFRQSGVLSANDDSSRLAAQKIRKARKARRNGEVSTVGDYLDILAGQTGRGWGD